MEIDKQIELGATIKSTEGGRNRVFVSLCQGAAHCDARISAGILRYLAPSVILVLPALVLRSPLSAPQPKRFSLMSDITIDTDRGNAPPDLLSDAVSSSIPLAPAKFGRVL